MVQRGAGREKRQRKRWEKQQRQRKGGRQKLTSKLPRLCWCWVLQPPPLPAHILQPVSDASWLSCASTLAWLGSKPPGLCQGIIIPIQCLSSPAGSFFCSGPHPKPAHRCLCALLLPSALSLLIATFSRALSTDAQSCLCSSRCQLCPKPTFPSSCLPLSGFSSLGIETAKASAPGSLLVLSGRTNVKLARGQRQHNQGGGHIHGPERTHPLTGVQCM